MLVTSTSRDREVPENSLSPAIPGSTQVPSGTNLSHVPFPVIFRSKPICVTPTGLSRASGKFPQCVVVVSHVDKLIVSDSKYTHVTSSIFYITYIYHWICFHE